MIDVVADARCVRYLFQIVLRMIVMGVLLVCATGCVTRFRTAVPLSEAQRRVVIGDLAVVGVVSRHPGRPGRVFPARPHGSQS